MREARSAFVATGGFDGGIDLANAPKYGPLLTRQDVHELCARVRELLRERNKLQEEVSELRGTLGMLAGLRDLMAADAPALAHVANNGHIHRRVDAAGEGAITLPVRAVDPDDGPHDDQGDEDLDNTTGDGPSVEATDSDDNPATDEDPDDLQADEDAGDVSSVEAMSDAASAATPCADDPPDNHVQADTVEAGEDAGAISAPMPPASLLPAEHDSPVSPSVETEAGEGTTSQTSQPAPGDQMDPVETGGRPLAGTLLARILAAIEASPRPRRAWQLEKELGLARRPSSELSELVKRGCLERLREGVYSVPGRADYEGMVSADTNNP
jgi:hypothetical protein